MIKNYLKNSLFAAIFMLSVSAVCQQKNLVIDVDNPKAKIQPTMWGVFFEDINFGADGGLYAELVKNRSFEFTSPYTGWNVSSSDRGTGKFVILNSEEENTVNPRFARINIKDNNYRLTNSGFRGIGVKQNNTYNFSVFAAVPATGNIKIRVELVGEKGEKLGETTINPQGNEWKKYESQLTVLKTDPKAKLNIWFEGNGSIDVDLISLFPADTWKNRSNGLRADLVQLLADMKPGFLRFPGGCIVEGYDLETRYQWKNSIGNVEDRRLHINRWNTEFRHRLTPDYFQSFGLGFFEYFQLAEDIGAEPLPILNCGMACQFNSAESVPVDKLDPYVQDALDLIEFANGSTDSKWGKIRAEMGHPAPFNMKFLGIGNEQWGPQYFERYAVFEKAINEKYPDISLISGTGPGPDDNWFRFAKEELKKYKPQIVDEHYYRNPSWFLQNATRYDNYDRNTYKIFAGEYAAQSDSVCAPTNKNNWECALSEAAFMTGLERNADVVYMCAYAPLFAHTEAWQWTPDLIWFDNLKSFGTANYYVQKLFANYKGTDLISITLDNEPLTGQDGLYASATVDKTTNEIIIKMVNSSEKEQAVNFALNTKNKVSSNAKLIVLKSSDLKEYNTINEPEKIKPVEQDLILKGKKINTTLAPYSLSVIRVKQ